MDLPTSHQGMKAHSGDESTHRMLEAINCMMAEITKKDYQQKKI
ncbi:putative resolvase [Pseudomonas amygdali pv. myricae]|nr:putative resolvase [Pseudomonas amygdali pv. myricae]